MSKGGDVVDTLPRICPLMLRYAQPVCRIRLVGLGFMDINAQQTSINGKLDELSCCAVLTLGWECNQRVQAGTLLTEAELI